MTETVYAPGYALSAPSRRGARRDIAFWGFAAQIFVLVFLQKFVLPIPGAPISLPLVTLYAWGAYMLVTDRLHVSYLRLLMIGLMFAAVTVSQVVADKPISLLSYLEFLLLYAPFVFVWKVSREQHLRLMGLFQDAMLLGAAMVLLQLGWQAAFGLGNLPNLEKYVPGLLLIQGFNYAAPITWGEAFIRPNGLFFLEPSFASSFLSSALLIELMFFRRVWRIALYGGSLLGTVAATGVLMVLVAAVPLFLGRGGRGAVAAAAAGALGAVAAYYTGVLAHLTGRVAELGMRNSSGFQRLIAPTQQLDGVFDDPSRLFTGAGAGNAIETNVSLWPAVKVMVEYGAFPSVLFLATVAACMLGSANGPLALALFVAFNFTGGFLLNPVSVIQILVLVSLLAVREEPQVAPPPRGHVVHLRRRVLVSRAARLQRPGRPRLVSLEDRLP